MATGKDHQQPQQQQQQPLQQQQHLAHETEPGKLDVDVNTYLLQLNLLHPSLTRHRWHHFWHRLAHLHNDEMDW